jgi:hypothetical protein
MAEGRCVNGGRSDAAALREFWIKTALSRVISLRFRLAEKSPYSIRTSAAMASTIGTALATTHGSWRPRAAKVPDSPSYLAVACS